MWVLNRYDTQTNLTQQHLLCMLVIFVNPFVTNGLTLSLKLTSHITCHHKITKWFSISLMPQYNYQELVLVYNASCLILCLAQSLFYLTLFCTSVKNFSLYLRISHYCTFQLCTFKWFFREWEFGVKLIKNPWYYFCNRFDFSIVYKTIFPVLGWGPSFK